jgi:hypothetical protein
VVPEGLDAYRNRKPVKESVERWGQNKVFPRIAINNMKRYLNNYAPPSIARPSVPQGAASSSSVRREDKAKSYRTAELDRHQRFIEKERSRFKRARLNSWLRPESEQPADQFEEMWARVEEDKNFDFWQSWNLKRGTKWRSPYEDAKVPESKQKNGETHFSGRSLRPPKKSATNKKQAKTSSSSGKPAAGSSDNQQ